MIRGNWETFDVFIDDEPLDIERSRKVRPHSGTFGWNYTGSGPCQLSIALLLEFGATDNEAKAWYVDLTNDIIRYLPPTNFSLGTSRIRDWVDSRRIFETEFKDLSSD